MTNACTCSEVRRIRPYDICDYCIDRIIYAMDHPKCDVKTFQLADTSLDAAPTSTTLASS